MAQRKDSAKKEKPSVAEQVAAREDAAVDDEEDRPIGWISSGSTLLNLACTDTINGAYALGRLTHMAGVSGAGKTLAYLTMLAELCQDPQYDGYELYLDAAEEGMDMNVAKMFGKRLSSRLRQPHHDAKRGDHASTTVCDFFSGVAKCLNNGTPFIYGLDSFDAIVTDDDRTALDLLADGKELPGTYDMSKQKMSSKMLGNIISDIKETSSVLFIISQLRDNVGAMPGQSKSRIAGGRALLFYAHHQIWLKKVGKISDPKYKRMLGNDVVAEVSKNRSTGKQRSAAFPIYTDYGIDDIGSCVDFLVEMEHWGAPKNPETADEKKPKAPKGEKKPKSTKIDAVELDLVGTRSDIIKAADSDATALSTLRETVGAVWHEIEEKIALKRRNKYE